MNPMTNDEHPGITRLQARCAELEAQVTERTFDLYLAQADLSTARSRVAELEARHPEWMKRIQRERLEERERIIAHLGTAFLGFVAHAPDKHLFMVGTENIRAGLESMP